MHVPAHRPRAHVQFESQATGAEDSGVWDSGLDPPRAALGPRTQLQSLNNFLGNFAPHITSQETGHRKLGRVPNYCIMDASLRSRYPASIKMGEDVCVVWLYLTSEGGGGGGI